MSNKSYSPFNATIPVGQIPDILEFHFNTGSTDEEGNAIYSRRAANNLQLNDHKTNIFTLTPAFFGRSGIGKTQIVNQFAKRIKAKMIAIDITQYRPEDLTGLPCYIIKTFDVIDSVPLPDGAELNEDGKTYNLKVSSFAPQELFITNGKPTVLFIDEISACPDDLQIALYSLLLEGRIGTITLPDNCLIVAAGNTVQDFVPAFIFKNQALFSRLMMFECLPDKEAYIKRGESNPGLVHPVVLSYMKEHPDSNRFFNTRNTLDEHTGNVRLISEDSRVWDQISACIYKYEKLKNKNSRNNGNNRTSKSTDSNKSQTLIKTFNSDKTNLLVLQTSIEALLSEKGYKSFYSHLENMRKLPPITKYMEVIEKWEKEEDMSILECFKDATKIPKGQSAPFVPREDLSLYSLVYYLSDYVNEKLSLSQSHLNKEEEYKLWCRTFIILFECIENRTKREDQIHFDLIYSTLAERLNIKVNNYASGTIDSCSETIEVFTSKSTITPDNFNLSEHFTDFQIKQYEKYCLRMKQQIGGSILSIDDSDL